MSVRRETRERGTGITARKVERVEITGQMGAQERKGLAELFRGPFDFEGLYGGRLEAECQRRLLDAGIERTRTVRGKIVPARNWREAVEDRGVPEDAPAGYAARILDRLESARQFASGAEAKNTDFLGSAMRYAFELGGLAMQADMKAAHEGDALRGSSQKARLNRYTAEKWGDPLDRAAKNAAILAAFAEIEPSAAGKMDAYRKTAMRLIKDGWLRITAKQVEHIVLAAKRRSSKKDSRSSEPGIVIE